MDKENFKKKELLDRTAKALAIRWENTRRDSRYEKACKAWLELKKKNKRKAGRAYLEIVAKYDFPPMDCDKSLHDNYKEQNDFIVFITSTPSEKVSSGRKSVKEPPFFDSRTFNLMAAHGQDAILRVRGYSEGMLYSIEEAEKVSPLKFRELCNPEKDRIVRIDLNLMYSKEQIAMRVDDLIEHLKRGAEKSERYEFKDHCGQRHVLTINRESRMFNISIDMPHLKHTDSRTRSDQYVPSYKFVAADFKKHFQAAFTTTNETLIAGWDGGMLRALRERKADKTEWAETLNRILSARMNPKFYETFRRKKLNDLSIHVQQLLNVACKQPAVVMSEFGLIFLHRKLLESAYPRHIRKTGVSSLTLLDCKDSDVIDYVPGKRDPYGAKQQMLRKKRLAEKRIKNQEYLNIR